ncbi:kynureninase [Nitrospirillum sp. BR 11163]|uniref:kynureninase n=1 Tax=Nitrospirillum sp. BR 11163 TaxID=3104323 RepID=UPI002B00173C|nr:kynureninase [Nitrospirillum sp. BR 11163]MEA1673094.1 kynureninase [Nitrospirillum sp. BR 11163]
MPLDRAACAALDRDDPLAEFRDAFEIADGVIYLDGNSLGALPKATRARLADVVAREWGGELIRGWNTAGWITMPQRVGDRIASLIGAEADEVIAADSTSVNLFKLATAALALRPGRRVIVTEPGNFPTDLYILQGVHDLLGDRVDLRVVEPDRIEQALDADTALLLLTQVHYKTGRIHDMARLTAKAHAAGALALWDLSHSAGAIDVNLNAAGADLAVGCGYKYLNGGPGAPAFLFVAKRHQARLRSPLSGWMGHATPFTFGDDYVPAPGVERMLCGTPPILGLAALEVGVDLMASADRRAIRAKSMALGDLFIRLVEHACPDQFTLHSPRDAQARGSQVSFGHADGYAIMQALIARGVIGDFRAPDVIRFGFAPLYVRYVDVYDAAMHLKDIMDSGAWRDAAYQTRGAVT